MLHPFQLITGALLAAGVAGLAYRLGALTQSGAVTSWAVGLVVFGVGGWAWAVPLLTFFGTSSALSRWRRGAKAGLGYAKSGRRDAAQVGANGGVAAACALLPLLWPGFGEPRAFLLFLAALAAANADTWATEIGSAIGGRPYDLRTGKRALPGTSGAISLGGTLAALAGAAVIGSFAPDWQLRVLAALTGLAGALVDSLLGAFCQAQWRDPLRPGGWTEQPQSGPPERGWRRLNNDAVNFLCTLTAAALIALLEK